MNRAFFYYFRCCYLIMYLMYCGNLLPGLLMSCQKGPVELSPDEKLLAFSRGSFRGDLKKIEKLLETGVDCNVQDDTGSSPLHYAASRSNVPLASLLLKHGASPELKDKSRRRPREIVATSCFNTQKRLFLAELDKDRPAR